MRDVSTGVAAAASTAVDPALPARFDCQQYVFLALRPGHGAGDGCFCAVLHGRPNRDCVIILRGFVPALRASAWALACEIMLLATGTMSVSTDRELPCASLFFLFRQARFATLSLEDALA